MAQVTRICPECKNTFICDENDDDIYCSTSCNAAAAAKALAELMKEKDAEQNGHNKGEEPQKL